MKARLEVKFGEDFGITNSFEQRIDTWEGVLIFEGVIIEGSIIEHHPLFALDLFSSEWVNGGTRIDEHCHSAMSGCAWSYDTKFKECSNMPFE